MFRTLFLLLVATFGFAVDPTNLGIGPAPAGSTIYTGGAVPLTTQIVSSDGTALRGSANFTDDFATKITVAYTTDATSGSAAGISTLGGIGVTKSIWGGANLTLGGAASAFVITSTSSTSSITESGTNTALTLSATGSNAGTLAINAVTAGTFAGVAFKDAGTAKWNIYKDASNGLSIYDVLNAVNAMVLTPGAVGASFITYAGTLDASSSTVAANVMSGGLAIAKKAFVGDATAGAITLPTAGGGVSIKSGANARCGTAVLAAGTITVANTSVTANTRVMVTVQTPGGTQGFISTSKVNATSFTVTSTSATETSTVAWELVENP